jgi:hypothetical protein
MDSNCGLNKCLFNCFLTVIITIAAIAILDVVLYLGYAYFSVQQYYSRDIKRWRDRELAKYGEVTEGWNEINPPSESVKPNVLAGNSTNLWTVATDGSIYTCKKPCDGTDDTSFWRKYEGSLVTLSATDKGLWGVASDNTPYSNTTGAWENKGSWTRQPGIVGLINIAMGPQGWVWGVNQKGKIFMCKSQWKCGRDWKAIPIKGSKEKVVQVAVGNKWVWALTVSGRIYFLRIDGKSAWQSINTPDRAVNLKLIAVGLSDNLYGIDSDGNVYKCQNPTSKKTKWTTLTGSPKLKTLTVNTEMYGVDANGLMWTTYLN